VTIEIPCYSGFNSGDEQISAPYYRIFGQG